MNNKHSLLSCIIIALAMFLILAPIKVYAFPAVNGEADRDKCYYMDSRYYWYDESDGWSKARTNYSGLDPISVTTNDYEWTQVDGYSRLVRKSVEADRTCAYTHGDEFYYYDTTNNRWDSKLISSRISPKYSDFDDDHKKDGSNYEIRNGVLVRKDTVVYTDADKVNQVTDYVRRLPLSPVLIPTDKPVVGPKAIVFEIDNAQGGSYPSWGDEAIRNAESVMGAYLVSQAQNQTPSGGGNKKAVYDFAERMYTVVLGRESDPAGKESWAQALLNHKIDGAGLAAGFLYSPEFQNKSLSNEEFVKVLYRTFLNREPDTGGFDQWVGVLDAGKSRGSVIAGFVNSQEFTGLCASYGIDRGTMDDTGVVISNPGIGLFVERCYNKALGRGSDPAGKENWVNAITCGTDGSIQDRMLQVATHGFFHSPEFLNKNLSNEDFVEVCYNTFLGRGSDAAGKSNWVQQLNEGHSRDEIMAGFAYSPEFGQIVDSFIKKNGEVDEYLDSEFASSKSCPGSDWEFLHTHSSTATYRTMNVYWRQDIARSQEMINEINKLRAENGVPALAMIYGEAEKYSMYRNAQSSMGCAHACFNGVRRTSGEVQCGFGIANMTREPTEAEVSKKALDLFRTSDAHVASIINSNARYCSVSVIQEQNSYNVTINIY